MEMLSVCFSDSNINSFPILTKENKLKIWLPNQEVERVRRHEVIQYYLTNEINEGKIYFLNITNTRVICKYLYRH